MKIIIKLIGQVIYTLIIGTAAVATIFWQDRIIWPEFPNSNELAPQIVIEVERSFGWHVGDLIPVKFFMKETPEIKVDLDSLSCEGDFEFTLTSNTYQYISKNGVRYTLVNMNLQSFNVTNSLLFRPTIYYDLINTHESKLIKLPATRFYMSNMWDGRAERQEGPLDTIISLHMFICILVIICGCFGFGCTMMSLISENKKEKQTKPKEVASPTPTAMARQQFAIIWERIQSSQADKNDYEEIECIVRDLYTIPAVICSEIPLVLAGHPLVEHITKVITLCDLAIYQGAQLSMDEQQELHNCFKIISAEKEELLEVALFAKLIGQQ